ncbi:hypothetical protein ACMT1E_10375 [Sphingomonas flavalba]|uniref:hypothetical protein n=1 Tax=Sphingomonas flavalba TaxID=2559804 RepID=UPI0039DFCC12
MSKMTWLCGAPVWRRRAHPVAAMRDSDLGIGFSAFKRAAAADGQGGETAVEAGKANARTVSDPGTLRDECSPAPFAIAATINCPLKQSNGATASQNHGFACASEAKRYESSRRLSSRFAPPRHD